MEHFVGDSRELEHVVSRKLVRFAVATSLFSNAFHEGYSTRSFRRVDFRKLIEAHERGRGLVRLSLAGAHAHDGRDD